MAGLLSWPKHTSPLLSLPPPLPSLATNCSVEGQACAVGQDNLLTSHAGVESVQECGALCTDNLDCEFLTYFGPESFPFRNTCFLYSECSIFTDCQDCTTAPEICFEQTCSSNLEGALEENVLEIIGGVEEEMSCKAFCRNESACEVYTYHDTYDLFLPRTCIMLSEIRGPYQSCQNCSTGFPDCRNITGGLCAIAVGSDDTLPTSYQFTEIGDTPVSILTLGNCELTVVAVGGGGGGSGYYGGGGSGYVASTNITVSPSQLVVRVGGPGETSSLQNSQARTLISADPGGNGYGYDGGDGYSGGGGGVSDYGYNGGMDGGNGGGREGGEGSGLDISSIALEQFRLSPGVGGSGTSSHGGGGGGVMVGGSGPQETVYDGQGYGGGGGGVYDHPGPGLVLLEIKRKL